MKKLSSKILIGICTLATIFSVVKFGSNNNSKEVNAASPKPEASQEYFDTKNKSADAQIETSIGMLYELPLYKDNEKIKNIIKVDSSKNEISNAELSEIKNICLNSPYLYDEVYIMLENNDCIKYNPFTDESLNGILDDELNFSIK